MFLRLAALWRDDRFIDVKGQKEAENRKFKAVSNIYNDVAKVRKFKI